MKFISWNVNGLRACVQKGFLDFFRETDADFFCVQETKLQEGQISWNFPRDIMTIGIMQKRRDILGQPYLQNRNLSVCSMG